MKNKIFVAIFAVWIFLWISFIARELFRKGYLYDYKMLLSRSLEGKRSYVTGDRFYEFLLFCNDALPRDASYKWVGVEEGSHAKRRATYYLYPHLEKGDAEFILVYDKLYSPNNEYGIFAELDQTRYILSKKGRAKR